MPQIKNAQQMLDIILPIPSEKIIPSVYYDGDGRGCFLGQIHNALGTAEDEGDRFYGDWDGYGARKLTSKFLFEKHGLEQYDGAHVNNAAGVNGYNEDTPKERIVHMLQDMIAAGY